MVGVGEAKRSMERWLGDGGMALVGDLGAELTTYGVDGEDLGWVEGVFVPDGLAANPHGVVQAGVHSVLLDACMNFAINAALSGRDRTRATLELKTETMRPALVGVTYRLRGEVVRLTRQVAYSEAVVRGDDGSLISRATGTFLLHREAASSSVVNEAERRRS
ncbi:MAG: PaaI family thioesterase [Acidimicrobiales bacterium]